MAANGGIRGVPAPLTAVVSSLSVMSETSAAGDSLAEFDPTRPTCEVYTLSVGAEAARMAIKEESHTAVFRQARMMIDHSYHGMYKLERQAVQDRIVMAIFERGGMTIEADGGLCETDDPPTPKPDSSSGSSRWSPESDDVPPRPFAVWTAGAMGAGKGHTLRRLKQAGAIFPISAFVAIDPDEVKSVLPDTPLYLAADLATGSGFVHKESTFVAELAENVAFIIGASLLVDGSLRDHRWYSSLFRRYAKVHPEYRLGIIHVHAPAEVVRARAASRAQQTGRVVPPHVLEGAIEEVPKSVAILSDLVEFTVTIDNGAETGPPAFVAPFTAEAFSRIWDGIRGAWVARMYEEQHGIVAGEPVTEDLRAGAAARARLANATAHAVARSLDQGRDPVQCDLRAPVPRRPALASMASMTAYPPLSRAESGRIGFGPAAREGSAARPRGPGGIWSSSSGQFGRTMTGLDLPVAESRGTSLASSDSMLRVEVWPGSRQASDGSAMDMVACSSLHSTLTSRIGWHIAESGAEDEGELSFSQLASLLESDQLRATAARRRRRSSGLAECGAFPSRVIAAGRAGAGSGTDGLTASGREFPSSSSTTESGALGGMKTSALAFDEEEKGEMYHGAEDDLAMFPAPSGLASALSVIQSAAESMMSMSEMRSASIDDCEASGGRAGGGNGDPATGEGGGRVARLAAALSAASSSGTARLGASLSAGSAGSRGLAAGAGMWVEAGVSQTQSLATGTGSGAGTGLAPMTRSATATPASVRRAMLGSEDSWMAQRRRVGFVDPSAAMRLWLLHRTHAATELGAESTGTAGEFEAAAVSAQPGGVGSL